MNANTIIKAASIGLKKNGGKIAIGAGIAGTFVGVYAAATGTIKAQRIVEGKDLTKKEVVKACWKCYIPTACIMAASTALIVIGVKGESKKYTALAAAYTLLDKSHTDLKAAIDSVVSDEDKKTINETVAKKNVDRQEEKKGAIADQHVFKAGDGTELFLDSMSGRLFYSSMDEIKQALIELNYSMLNGGSNTLNDLYYELGLDGTKLGEDLGWSADRGQLTARFDGSITDDGRACIVFSPSELPRPVWMV